MISHEHRFIFVHASRTGGSSLERQYHVGLENENGIARHWVALEDRYGR